MKRSLELKDRREQMLGKKILATTIISLLLTGAAFAGPAATRRSSTAQTTPAVKTQSKSTSKTNKPSAKTAPKTGTMQNVSSRTRKQHHTNKKMTKRTME